MRVTVIGCSGSFPGPDAAASCYLVEAEGFHVLLDLGSGALGALQRHLDIYDIDAVLLSHLHPDHCLDMCPYYVARKYRPEGPARQIPVYGPAGTAERLVRAYGDLPAEAGMHAEFDFRTWPQGMTELGPLRITVEHVAHPVETFGMRLEHTGGVFAYSGDSGECDALVRLAAGADLFLCEASFHEGRDSSPGLHLTGRTAAQHAARADVGRLVLTHVPPWNDPDRTLAEARPAYGGPVQLAAPGAAYDL